MEKARRKLRICLIFVVVVAAAAGLYYYYYAGEDIKISEGTLVMHSVTREENKPVPEGGDMIKECQLRDQTVKETEQVTICRL